MRLLRSLVHLNRYMEGKERRRKKPPKELQGNSTAPPGNNTTSHICAMIHWGGEKSREEEERVEWHWHNCRGMNEWNLFNCGWQLARKGHKDFYMCPSEDRFYSEIFRTVLLQVLFIFLVSCLSHPPSPPSPLTAQLILEWFSRNGLMQTSSAE